MAAVAQAPHVAAVESMGNGYVPNGDTNIADDVVAQIAARAAQEVEGVAALGTSSIRRSVAERIGATQPRSRGILVETGTREAIVDVTLRVDYGRSIPELAAKVRANIAVRLRELCGLVAKEVNVNIVGLEFADLIPTKRVE